MDTKDFLDLADRNPDLATIMLHIAITRLGGALRITRKELEAYEGVEIRRLVMATMSEEDQDYVDLHVGLKLAGAKS